MACSDTVARALLFGLLPILQASPIGTTGPLLFSAVFALRLPYGLYRAIKGNDVVRARYEKSVKHYSDRVEVAKKDFQKALDSYPHELATSSTGFSLSIRKLPMFWITALALFMAAALIKLGVSLVMVSILTAALWATVACIAVLLAFVMWKATKWGR